MPKKVNVRDLVFHTQPFVEEIHHNCKPGCTHKTCVKYFSITSNSPNDPSGRYSSGGITSWKEAKAAAQELAEWLKPANREEREKNAARAAAHVKIDEVFRLYIEAKTLAQDPKTLEECGPNAGIGKFKTLRKELCGDENNPGGFLAKFNARPDAKRKIGAGETACISKLEYFDQITTYWLDHEWRPTWFGGKGSWHSKNKRRDLVIEIGHWAQKAGHTVDTRSRLANKCECTFCKMFKAEKGAEDVPPTPPLELWQYAMIVDACALFEASYRDNNIEQLRITNDLLRAFIEVMCWCGPRISDASLMAVEDIHYDRNERQWIWSYLPLKNRKRKKGGKVSVPVPDPVKKQLDKVARVSEKYYFWSGESVKRNAADPWQRALTRLWTLCPKESQEIHDKRNKQKVHTTSHMFRNTYCVQCRLSGMSYAQIAESIGDTEKVVTEHYAAYCEEFDRQNAGRVAKMQAARIELSKLSLEELKARSRGSVIATMEQGTALVQ